jgi:hypothetical protein
MSNTKNYSSFYLSEEASPMFLLLQSSQLICYVLDARNIPLCFPF